MEPEEGCAGEAGDALRQPILAQKGRSVSGNSAGGGGGRYLRDLHMLSCAFLFIFLAYCALQNLESSINRDRGLGSAALGVLYLTLTFSSLGAPLVVLWLGSKRAFLVGLSGYWVFMLANFVPSWFTLIPAAIFLGLTASVMWVAEGTYITFAAKGHAAACNMSEEAALGDFNGEFWSFFSLTQVIGNLVTLVLLQSGNDAEKTSKPSSVLLLAFLGSMAIGSVLIFLLRPHAGGKSLLAIGNGPLIVGGAPRQGLASASFALLSEEKMLLLICLFCYTGMQQAFIWGDFTNDVVTSTLGLSWIGGVMAAYGAADTLASFLAGRISSGLFSISSLLCGGAVCQMLVLAGLSFKHLYSDKDVITYVTIFSLGIVWGFGDATFNTQISALLGIFYPNSVEAAFAQWKVWQSAGTSLVFFASPYVGFTVKVTTLFLSLLVSIGLFFMAMARSSRTR